MDIDATIQPDRPDAQAHRPVPDDRVNILLVDDLPEKLMVYETILSELDQNLIVAHSGEEALMLVLKYEFAVILLDVNMPGMDGFETATLIRSRKKSARTPIIFLTAFLDEMNAAQGYASGAVDYLPTPVVPEVLKAKIRVFIELSQMRQQAATQAEERARRTAAEEADRRKDEFLGMLAHELRNPLGPIRNATQLLQLIGSSDPKILQLSDIIDRQARHMARLIDDLLDATRLARGQILLRKEPFCNLTRIVRQTAEDYAATFEASGIDLEIIVSDGPTMVEGDPTRLVQAIGNLLHNAHKFTSPGGKVTVSIERDPDGASALISVRDSGIGIEAAILPCVFDVFRQAEQSLDRSRGGLGLGLPLVKGLVELHGGRVGVHSDGLNRGSTFTITLPIVMERGIVANDTAPVSFSSVKSRILIIEDNRDSAESARMLLSLEGHEVQVAYTGSDGLDLAKIFRPDIILCDIGLPGMNGYDVARQLRKDAVLSKMLIIALTGYGRDEDQNRARQAGFDLHLTKPIDYQILRRALAHA